MKQKRMIDIILFILLLLLMEYSFMDSKIHEVLGILTLFTILIHQLLNKKWFVSITKGKYTTIRKIFLIVNIVLVIDIVLAFISGLAMSELLPMLHFVSANLARKIHMVSVHWGFVLIAMHLGMHLKVILLPMRKIILKTSHIGQFIFTRFIPYVMILLGIFSFIKNQMIAYLFMLTDFVYFDENISFIQSTFEYFSIFIAFASLIYFILNSISNKEERG